MGAVPLIRPELVFIRRSGKMDIEKILDPVSIAQLFVAILVNSFFAYIVCKKGEKKIGTYKYLLISFAACNIIYSSSEFLAKPIGLVYRNSIMVYSKGLFTKVQPTGTLLLCFFSSMYGLQMAILALHFLYRYVVVCR
ncbi:unnamed protein product [Strongylus vulgaris]|uniref:Very-long-chain 3-oxoacyl-CoA synthase n=1 Tax=Strongylus vulgaris TaxID=40348 RepID=A0A3P7IHE1_STRVU|nr:unnamed protein product [Strongylus vulgaris]